jgi:8-amino-7-oxononanoate synthase
MSTDLFDKFQPIMDLYQALPDDTDDPFAVKMEKVYSPTEALINGRRTILAGTNNYMGMTFDPEAMEAAHAAIDAFGTGTTGSRVLNGTYRGHQDLEDALKDFFSTDYAMVFSTGYQANLGVIATLAGKDEYIIIDADSHASIYDGCAMGNADILRFRHNDAEDLEKRLRRLPKDAGKLVVIEAIYSMLGDIAPLKEIVEVAKRHGAMIIVDEAHSMGYCGKTGAGVTQSLGLEADVDFIIGTFSKSVGTVGGFCVSNHSKFEVLRLVCRPYMFTASLPPSVIASALASIKTLKNGDNLRGAVWDNAKRLHAGLKQAGFKLATDKAESPISAVCLDNPDITARFWSELLAGGIYVNMAIPPATPSSLCLLRCSIGATHSFEQIDKVIETFVKTAKKLGLNLSEKPPGDEASQTEKGRQSTDAAAAMGSA